MHNRILIHSTTQEDSWRRTLGIHGRIGSRAYPETFDARQEVYNTLGAKIAGLREDQLAVVIELLNVLLLYELGVHRMLGLFTEKLYPQQFERIRVLVGDGGQVDFVPWTPGYRESLSVLSEHFHVRLHKYYEGSEDEFLAQVVTSLRR